MLTDQTVHADPVETVRSVPAFSRWGDGEWTAVLQTQPNGHNCDGHHYFPDLGKALGDVMRHEQRYQMGMQPLARMLFGKQIDAWMRENAQPVAWCDADIFHNAAMRGEWEWKSIFEGGSHAVVGPLHLRSAFPRSLFIEVPLRECWLSVDRIVDEASKVVNSVERVGFCAGMASNVMIDRLFGCSAQLIDFGSVFDPFAGVKSREYMK